jgi:hypothetical protein
MAMTDTPSNAFDYYVTNTDGLYRLRQTRFKAQYDSGREHPYDVCAVARSKEELKGMVESCKFKGLVNWNFVE